MEQLHPQHPFPPPIPSKSHNIPVILFVMANPRLFPPSVDPLIREGRAKAREEGGRKVLSTTPFQAETPPRAEQFAEAFQALTISSLFVLLLVLLWELLLSQANRGVVAQAIRDRRPSPVCL